MKIVFGSTGQTETLTYGQLSAGKVYTNVADNYDNDLYMKTDMGHLVSLSDGLVYEDADFPTARFLEVDVELVVKK